MNHWLILWMGIFSGSLAVWVASVLPLYLARNWRAAALDYLQLKETETSSTPNQAIWKISFSWLMMVPIALQTLACFLLATQNTNIMHIMAGMVLTWFLLCLSLIDMREQLLPDELTLPLLWLGLLYHVVVQPDALSDAVIGAALGYVFFRTLYHVFKITTGKEGMGFGDFKMAAALGAWLGWQLLLPMIFLAAVLGLIFALLQATMREKAIAFGPFLAMAAWCCWWQSESVEQMILWLMK